MKIEFVYKYCVSTRVFETDKNYRYIPHFYRMYKNEEIRINAKATQSNVRAKIWEENLNKVKATYLQKVKKKYRKDEKFLIFVMPTSKETYSLFIQPLLESVMEEYKNASFQNVFHKKDEAVKFGSDEFKKMSFSEKKELIEIDEIPVIDSSIERAIIIDDVCSSGESIKFLERLIKENFKNINEINAVVFLKIERSD
jgi:hypoxanthine-guanine phosphoribosyltransferase